MRYCYTSILMLSVLFLCSCGSTRDIAYMQDLAAGQQIESQVAQQLKAQPDDKLTIVVTCDKPVLASMFNLPYVTNRIGTGGVSSSTGGTSASTMTSGENGILSYTVDKHGDIDFPVFGKIHVAGLERAEIAAMIRKKLIDSNQIKDPTVIVEFVNHYVTVIGEVARPGRFSLNRDKTTLLDMLGMAGDLTISGKRQPVKVLRNTAGDSHQVYEVDLCKGVELLRSPVFYMQPNDLVYVEPNNKRSNESTINGNTLRTPSFWLSLGSFLLTLGVLVFK